MIEEISRIKGVIDKFQEGYLNRDLEEIMMTFSFPTIYPPDLRFSE